MTEDLLERLRVDPGKRTLGELLQEREWALREIVRLRAELLRTRTWGRQTSADRRDRPESPDNRLAQPDPSRLLRLKEVCAMVGFAPSSIYKMIGEHSFPAQVKVGPRCVRWRMSDVLAWQSSLLHGNQ